MEQRRPYLFNYAFIGSLVLLVLNDHVFKTAFHNDVTGKLSDFSGMVILPLFLAFIFPKLKINAVWISMAFFAFWKSSLSEPVVNACNAILPFGMERVVDYTDLWAFLIVPVPYFIIKDNVSLYFLKVRKVMLNPVYIVLPTLVALIATAPPKNHFHRHYRPATGDINLKEKNVRVTVGMSVEAILEKLKKEGICYTRDSIVYVPRYCQATDSMYVEPYALNPAYPPLFYKVERLVIEKDTLEDIQFSFIPIREGAEGNPKTKIYLNSLNIGKDLTDEEVKEKMTGYYKNLLKRYFNSLD